MYEAFGLERFAGTRADGLSEGTLAKLNLSLALMADRVVLLLDESYAGFDFDSYLKFWDLEAAVGRSGHRAPAGTRDLAAAAGPPTYRESHRSGVRHEWQSPAALGHADEA